MASEFELTGNDQVIANLLSLASATPAALGRSLFAEASIEMAEAQSITPVEFDVLRPSGHVNLPVISGDDASVELGFGGPAAQYAAAVHEDLEAFHPRGGQAKYLETPLAAAAPHLPNRIAARYAAEVGL